ncbi:MAG TPA: AI-2E family transporter [Jiangellaceae bacterium]|nr:AI-2E family transporter [Jiangellaceae bacterium]
MSANTEGGHEGEQPSSVELRLNPGVFVHIVGGLLVAFAGFALFRSAPKALTTIAVGSVFALALDPIVGVIRRNWGWPRSRSVLLVAGGAIVLVVTVVVGMGPQAVDQARKVTSDVPQTVREFYDLPVVGGWLEDNDVATRAADAIDEVPGKISDRSVTRTVEGMVGGALSTVLVLGITVAVLLDGDYLVAAIRRLVPHRWVNRVDEIGHVFYMAIAQYFAGSLAVAALMGVVVLALCLIFGVPLAPLAALWAMITDLIPQVGGFLGGALLGLLALTQGAFVFVVVVGLYVVYMTLENHVISPAIVGHAVDVSPPTSMLAALIGGAAGGVAGALVATPLVGATKQLYLQLRWGQQPFASERQPLRDRVKTVFRTKVRRPRPTPRGGDR